jgi:hypothetical protein
MSHIFNKIDATYLNHFEVNMKILIMTTGHCSSVSSNGIQIFQDRPRSCKREKVKFVSECSGQENLILSKEIHEWLKYHKITEYTLTANCRDDLSERKIYWYIDIPDENKAMLFKLTWC